MMADEHLTPASNEQSKSTSLSLIERVRLREPAAWQRFSELYGPVVYRWAQRHGLQPHDAADVVQEVFASVAQNLGGFSRRTAADTFHGWLRTVTRNKVLDVYRRRQNEPAAAGGSTAHRRLEQLPVLPECDDEPADSFAADISHRALLLIQTEFEATTWQAFWAVAVEGKAPADAARDLGLTVAAVYKAKSRVLLRLRQELDGLLD